MSSSPRLEPVRRVVTSHNEQVQAVVSRDDLLLGEPLPHGSAPTLIWSSEAIPADVDTEDDRAKVETGLVSQGSVLRVVDFPPQSVGRLHRSISLDYVVVLKGTVSLTLDDGSKTALSEGTVVVQQATMHGWDNDTDQWARILCTMLPAKAPVVNGVELGTIMTFSVK